jgi:hypothetical protein
VHSENIQVSDTTTSQGGPPDKTSTWFEAAAVIVLKGILLLVVANLILYIIILIRRQPIKVSPADWYGIDNMMKAYPGWREEDVKTMLSETWKERENKFEYEAFTGFKHRPFRGKFVNVDPAGFRLSKDQAPWPPSPQAFNVFVFGGSTTFGSGLPDDQTIASYLQDCAPPDPSSGRMAVYNFGRSGYFSSQERALFEQLLNAGFVPKVAIFIDGVNDFWLVDGQPSFTDRLKRFMDGKPEGTLLDGIPMIQAAHALRKRMTPQQPQNADDPADPAILQAVINRWLANKKMIELIAAGFGVRPIFVWQPVTIYKYDLRYHFLLHSDKDFDERVRCRYGYAVMDTMRQQGKLGPNVLWLADIQQDKHENLYVDQWHYTAPFSQEIAGRICGFLRQPQGEMASSRN